MSRDGNGNYSLPEAPFVYDTVIDETAVNSNFSDIASALTASIAKDGQTAPTANLPMATYKHTGVGNASARDQYAAMGQVQDGAGIWCGTAGGTADALTLTPSPAITAYAAGQRFDFKSGASANAGAVTFAISGLSAIAGQVNGAACAGGEIAANQWYRITISDASTAQIERIGEGISGPAIGSGKVPQWNGSSWAGVTPGAGTVTSIIAGTGLTGGTITSSGTIAVDTSVVGTKNAASTWTAPQRGTVTTDNDLSFDQSVTNNFFCTPTGSGTLTFTNHTAGQSGFVLLVNGSNYAITAAATTKINSADLTTISATGTYLLSYLDNGTNAYVVVSKELLS
jgi:hypothetical protein